MMRRFVVLMLVSVFLMTLVGCQNNKDVVVENTDTQIEDVTETEIQTEEQTEELYVDNGDDNSNNDEGESVEYYIEMYREVFDLHRTGLSEKWDMSQWMDKGLSGLNAYPFEAEPLKSVGYTIIDVDGDGVCEFVFGAIAGDEFVEKIIFEMYTLKDDKPVQVFVSHERNRYYLVKEEAGGYHIVNESSNGAANSAHYYYNLQDGELVLFQGIVFDAFADEENPWFMTYDTDWDVSNDEPISEELAEDIIRSYRNNYMKLDYIRLQCRLKGHSLL